MNLTMRQDLAEIVFKQVRGIDFRITLGPNTLTGYIIQKI